MADENRAVPTPGLWPVDPQNDVPIIETRLWVDGCFDFTHHGHAGALLQARQLGNELWVGIHSDEDISRNKGPTVMTLRERIAAVNACRWITRSVPYAPYVTSLQWITHYGCQLVVHGDDITSDSNGEDCYRFVKAAGRFLTVKRTPEISTTDLVGRVLSGSKTHFINHLDGVLSGQEGPGTEEDRIRRGRDMIQRIKDYAQDEEGHDPELTVFRVVRGLEIWQEGVASQRRPDSFYPMIKGKSPFPDQRVVYVDGVFDLFSAGHVEFLRQVILAEDEIANRSGWYGTKKNHGPVYLMVGIYSDEITNSQKGSNYPIMNIFERGLCLLQCKFVNSVVFSAPINPKEDYLKRLPFGPASAVYHGPRTDMPIVRPIRDPYQDAKDMGIYKQIGNHDFQYLTAEEIVRRIETKRDEYEARQRAKEGKAIREAAVKQREAMEVERSG